MKSNLAENQFLLNKKIWKEKDTPACLCRVFGRAVSDILYICEGFKDAYILAQWMNYPDNATIITPSNGVGTIHGLIPTIQFGNFKEIKLMLDNDEAGQKALATILDDYPFMIDKTPKPKEGKDISDLYKERK